MLTKLNIGVKVIFCTFLAACSLFSVTGQSIPKWKKGTVVLSNQTVFAGEISYQQLQDIILFRSDDKLSVFPAPRIQLFRYYDEPANINRQFISVRLEDRRFKFFEVVLQGPVKVVRCAKRWASGASHDEIEDFSYFIWDGTQLEPIGKFQDRIYPKLIEEQPIALHAFVTNFHLQLSDMKAAILIIKEYNRIVQDRQIVAQAN